MAVEELPPRSRRCLDEAFDLVVIDFLESPEATRVEAVRAAREKVRPGGYLLLDDSDRPGYAEAYELLAAGVGAASAASRTSWPEACETAIFPGGPHDRPPRNREAPERGLSVASL